MEKISIVIPVYNIEEYLTQCLNSILLQTYDRFELILIDDGSTDGSGLICDEYAKIDSRIKVIHIINSGVSAARNKGINVATGRYIFFVDSDDFVELDYCEVLYRQIEQHPNSWVFCGCNCVDANNNIIASNCVYDRSGKIVTDYSMSEYYNIWKTNYSALLWIRIFDLDIIKKHNIRFDENLSLSEDVLFNLEYGKYCDSFVSINLPLYNHRSYYNNEREHLDGKKIDNRYYLNKRIYSARKPFIPDNKLWKFETQYFYAFLDDIKDISNRSNLSKNEKIKIIRSIVKSSEFKTALKNSDKTMESQKLIVILKAGVPSVILKIFKES